MKVIAPWFASPLTAVVLPELVCVLPVADPPVAAPLLAPPPAPPAPPDAVELVGPDIVAVGFALVVVVVVVGVEVLVFVDVFVVLVVLVGVDVLVVFDVLVVLVLVLVRVRALESVVVFALVLALLPVVLVWPLALGPADAVPESAANALDANSAATASAMTDFLMRTPDGGWTMTRARRSAGFVAAGQL